MIKTKNVLKNFEELIKSYHPLLSQWFESDACSLTKEDMYTIEIHAQNNFTIELFESFMFYNQCEHLQKITMKLTCDYQKFKEWVILNFLFSIVELAGKNGGQNYLHQPIGTLDLTETQKKCLARLNIIMLNQLFTNYKEKDLENQKVFKVILEYETIRKVHFKNKNNITR